MTASKPTAAAATTLPSPTENGREVERRKPAEADATVKDPVCGMDVQLGVGKLASEWRGDDYHFCSTGCHDKFAADPWFYVSGNRRR